METKVSTNTKVAVVIPNWNGADFIRHCLDSISRQTQKHNLIVVDNGSEDNSKEIIKKDYPDVKLVELPFNTGFSGGVNRGIELAISESADYVALFNNDAQADKKWLKNLIDAAKQHPEAGIITGKFMRLDKKHIDSTGDMYSTHAMPFPRGRNLVDTGQYDKPEYVFGGTGGASLYSTKMLKEIGLFDEDFFAYFEDVDISFRAQLAGWKVWYQPTALAYHHVSGTSSKLGSFSRFHSIKNFIYIYHKNLPLDLFVQCYIWFLLRLGRMLLGSIRDKYILVFAKSLAVALIHFPATLAKRHKIQSIRKVSSEYIKSILYPGSPPKIPKL